MGTKGKECRFFRDRIALEMRKVFDVKEAGAGELIHESIAEVLKIAKPHRFNRFEEVYEKERDYHYFPPKRRVGSPLRNDSV